MALTLLMIFAFIFLSFSMCLAEPGSQRCFVDVHVEPAMDGLTVSRGREPLPSKTACASSRCLHVPHVAPRQSPFVSNSQGCQPSERGHPHS
jgi:hypothetical protein